MKDTIKVLSDLTKFKSQTISNKTKYNRKKVDEKTDYNGMMRDGLLRMQDTKRNK